MPLVKAEDFATNKDGTPMSEYCIYCFKDGAFKYELGKYQASLLINYIQKQKEIIDKAVEYITSYESISTIQGLTHAEDNKQLDEKTMVEMTNRYLLVHDKLLRILEDEEVSE